MLTEIIYLDLFVFFIIKKNANQLFPSKYQCKKLVTFASFFMHYVCYVIFKCSFVIFFSSFRKWKDALREAEVPFQEKFLPYAMSPYLRSQVSISEAKMTTQNLSILSALDDPILIIDPYQISLEYLELLHVDDKITMLHIGGEFLNNVEKLGAKKSHFLLKNGIFLY